MIDVYIVENHGLVAECTIEEAYTRDQFEFDLERLKSVPAMFRSYDPQSKVWSIRDPEKFKTNIWEIGPALEMHKRQLKMF